MSTRSLSISSEKTGPGISYATTISVFVIELLLHSPLLCFGVFYLKFSEEESFSKKNTLWLPVVYIAFWKFANPWAKQICEQFEDKFGFQKCLVILATFLMTSGVLASAFVDSLFWFVILYACFGGIGSSILNAQIKELASEDFQSTPHVLDGIRELSKCLGLFLMPYAIYMLSWAYDISATQAIFSYLLLHMIPAGFVLARRKPKELKQNLSKFRTCSGLLDDPNIIEMNPIHQRFLPYNPEENTYNNKINNMFNKLDEDFEFSIYDEDNQELKSKNGRNKTAMGVEIMPMIEEEAEGDIESDEDQINFLKNSIKRYSKNSQRLNEIIDKDAKNDVLLNVMQIHENGDANGRIERRDSRSSQNTRCNKKCCAYSWSRQRKKISAAFREFWIFSCLKPLKSSLKMYFFYPSLFTKSTFHYMAIIFLVVVPELALENSYYGDNQRYTQLEAIFLLSLISFSWLIFLITLIWAINMPKRRIRIVNGFGFAICSLCFLLASKYLSHELVTINCLLFGFGYGIVSYTEDIIIRESLGLSSSKAEGTLSVLSGFILIILHLVVHFMDYSLQSHFGLFSQIGLINVLLWICFPVLHFLWDYFSNYQQRGSLIGGF